MEFVENQILAFVKLWLKAYIALIYCYAIGRSVRKGLPRLSAVAPVICLFLALPLDLPSVILGGTTAFFLTWLANFKLLLFSFGRGPLCSDSLSLLKFVAVACLPINIDTKQDRQRRQSTFSYALKGLLLAGLVWAHDYTHQLGDTALRRTLVLVLYCFHIYLPLEIILAVAAAAARAALGVKLEPQFEDPYLATSLQDFWGRRWNLMVTRILRPAVYDPALSAASQILGRKWAPLPAVVATFAASALMHELMFFYLGGGAAPPTWEVTWFFVLHGLCLAAEIGVKRAAGGRFSLPRVVSGALTVAFVMSTGFWLFFPPLIKVGVDTRAFEEYAAISLFVRNVGAAVVGLGNVNATRLVGM